MQPTASRPTLRVAIADDAALFRHGLALLLAEAGFTVTAQAGDAQALLAAVRADPPDAVVVDIRMPPTHTTEGLDAARALARDPPGVGVLVLSAHVEPGYALDCSSPAPAGPATCSRSGWPTSTSWATPSAGSPRAGWSSTRPWSPRSWAAAAPATRSTT